MSQPENLGLLISETARAWGCELDRRLKPLGLSRARWVVLLYLTRGCDGVQQNELAQRIGIEGPTLVGLLDRMARDGWLTRRQSPDDRRAKCVYLSSKAESVMREIDRETAELRRELFRGLSEEDLDICYRVLAQLKQHLCDQ
jgi:MarR family transcriptional regulator for hemolysin